MIQQIEFLYTFFMKKILIMQPQSNTPVLALLSFRSNYTDQNYKKN